MHAGTVPVGVAQRFRVPVDGQIVVLGATLQQLSPDMQDVEKIAHRARSLETATGTTAQEQRPEDAGYFLLPLLALLGLFWSRRGWIVR